MTYWNNPWVPTLLSLAAVLILSQVLRRLLPALRRYGVPASILAGLLGLGLGPDLVDGLDFERGILEGLVYHGLAVVFIAMALMRPQKQPGKGASSVRSFLFAIPLMQSLQLATGLAVVLVLGLVLQPAIHPGLGAMLPLGFEGGPGQALALGRAWEQVGMRHGAQVGLIVAALGFGWSIVAGIPLVIWGRRRQLMAPAPARSPSPAGESRPSTAEESGGLDCLTRQLIAIAGCYGITWGLCHLLSSALSSMPDIAQVVWGFHFILGALTAMAVRPLLGRLQPASPLDDANLGRISGVTVDVMTCASLMAIQLEVFQDNWLPLLLITGLGGLVTLLACLWLSARAFPDEPFEHCLVWFGMSTGTMPMGLALLRVVDPKMRSRAPLAAVLGSAGAIPLGAVVMMFLIPGAVMGWSGDHPAAGWLWLAAALGFSAVVLLLWRLLGPLRFHRPLGKVWARREAKDA